MMLLRDDRIVDELRCSKGSAASQGWHLQSGNLGASGLGIGERFGADARSIDEVESSSAASRGMSTQERKDDSANCGILPPSLPVEADSWQAAC